MEPNTNRRVKELAKYYENIANEASTTTKSHVTKAAVGVEKNEDMASNFNKGLKRQDKDEMKNVASTSNQIQVNNSTVAAIVQANATYQHYGDTYINQHTHQQQSRPAHPPRGIELEVADPVASFRGRVEQLQLVKDAFNSPRNEKLNLVVVCGYGGIGKTEFSRKFVQQNRADFDNSIWINAEFESTMNGSFGILQDKLKDKGYSCTNKLEVYNHLNSDKSIFVFDNAENMWSIRSFLPQKQNDCLFFITSQFKNWSPYDSIPLDTLDLNSAMNVIKVIFDEHKIKISESQLRTLVGQFERIPLVLQIGAGFVCQEILDLKSIGAKYNIDNIIQALNTESYLVTQEFPVFSQDSYAKSVYKALSRTLDKIWTKSDEAYKLAANILGISSYLSADDISKKMLKEIVEMKNENLFNKSLAILVQFSLLKVPYSFISMHRTVQECVRYYCVNQLKSNKYYSQALQILLLDYGFEYMHYNVLFQHGESYLETFCTFYNDNKCRDLNRKLGKYISCPLLKHVLFKLGLIKIPEFLCEAVTRKQDDIKQLLLDHGADFNVVDDQGFSTLYYACRSGNRYTIKFNNWNRIKTLIEIGADVNSLNLEGNTVIHSLCNLQKTCMEKDESNIFGICALLIKFGGDPKIKNNAGQTPADLAREYGLALTRHLLDTVISGYPYIWHIAAECRQFKILDCLIEENVCNMNERDNSGRTILHVLAGLAQQDAEDEVKLLYDTQHLLRFKNADVSVVNNAGETAADVARRCGREKMADIFNGMDKPGRLILQTAALRNKLNHFQYVHSRSWEHANEQDDTGSTLMHALCGLDTRGDTELELDIVQLAADLVIQYTANVHIMNNAGATAADVARRHGRLLLADILDGSLKSGSFSKLMFFYLNHKQFSLLKYTWWRYCCLLFHCKYDWFPISAGIEVLHMLCSYEDPRVTDAELIRVFNDLDLKLVAECRSDKYYEDVVNAKQLGRDELFAWLKRYSTCDINEQDDSGCTLLHRLSDDYAPRDQRKKYQLNKIVTLVVYCDADVSIVNNAGETAAGVARRRGWETLADFLTAWAPPARTIYQIDAHRSKLQQLTFVNNNNVQNVNYLDDTGSTLLHALCGLDTRGDTELELDIVKLAAHLVIRCDADVCIMNNAGDTAADVARRHGRLLLADFLHPSVDATAFNLVSISVKLKQFELVKHAWWRYLYTTSHKDMYTSADPVGCRVLHILCEIEDLTVTDAELISLIHHLDLDLKQVAKYSNDFYNKVVTMARGNQRTELAAWLEKDPTQKYFEYFKFRR